MAKLICEVCGEEFIAYGKQVEIRRRCSVACYAIYLKTRHGEQVPGYNHALPIVPCDTCGLPIRLARGKSYLPRKHHFCSQHCYYVFRSKEYRGDKHHNWKGGVSYFRGKDWKEVRDKIRMRDIYSCQICGATEAQLGRRLDVHHKKPFYCFNSIHEANKHSNLITVCRSCHIKTDLKLKKLERFIPLPLMGGNH